MIRQQEQAFSNFVDVIANSRDLHYEQKLNILNYIADEYQCRDENLLYLECKQVIKELKSRERIPK